MHTNRRISRLVVAAAISAMALLTACHTGPSETDRGAGPPAGDTARPVNRVLREFEFDGDRVRLAHPEKHVSGTPRNVDKLLQDALDQGDAGRRAGALESLAAALAAAPRSADVYAALGTTLSGTRHLAKARAAFRHALALEPDHEESLYGLGLVEQSMGRRAQAVAAWRELVTRHPGHGNAHRRLAAALYLEGEPAAARAHLERAAPATSPAFVARLEALLDAGASPAPRAADATPPVVGPEIRVDAGPSFTSEPTIAAGPAPGQVIASWVETLPDNQARLFIGQSFDDGKTWEEIRVETPDAVRASSEGDPIIAVDRSTGDVWVSGLSLFSGIWVLHRPPLARGFGPPVIVTDDPDVDKPVMTVLESPLFAAERWLFLFHNQGVQSSRDQGATWSPPTPLGGFVGYHPAVADRGLFAVYADTGGGVRLVASNDQGRSFSGPFRVAERLDFWDTFGDHGGRFPGRFRVVQFPVLAADPRDETLYCAFIDTTEVVDGQSNVDVYVTRSENDGRFWTVPVLINGDGDPAGDQFLPWLHVDDSGRLHAIYYDTRHGGFEDGSETALVDAYYSYSEDRGDTWTEIRLTPRSFPSSSAWYTEDVEFIGDYLGISSRTTDGATRVYAIYMSTAGGDSDILMRTIDFGAVGGGEEPTCVADETSLCLQGQRFRVGVEWEDFQGQTGVGSAQALTPDTGYFWFFSRDNVEVTVKVLDGCSFTGHYWVFGAGMTDVKVRVTVEDTWTDEVRTYDNRLGDPFRAIRDTSAFAGCPDREP